MADAAPEPDSTICERARNGDRAAFGVLVERHSRRVVVTLLAEGHALDVARDLTQEAWAHLWESRSTLKTLVLPGLVITQARFLGRDLHRRNKGAPVSPGEADAAAPFPLADARLSSAQSLKRVQERLATVSTRAREVFELANGEGLPHEEVGRRLGLSSQRVRQIVWEVRTQLRAVLEEVS